MGFYQSEPWSTATAAFFEIPGGVGTFYVEVEGDAPNFTSGIQLVRDPHFVGGLKVNVMGWTGPRAAGTTPYKVHGTFEGEYREQIVVSGSNQTKLVPVQIIPAEEAEDHLRARADAA